MERQPSAESEQAGEQNVMQPKRRPGGRPWPKGVSGNPSGSRTSKRATELFVAMAADFGGVDALSGIERATLEQVARLLVRGDRAKDPDVAVKLANAAARLLTTLTKRKPAKAGPSLAQYLQDNYADGDGADAAGNA